MPTIAKTDVLKIMCLAKPGLCLSGRYDIVQGDFLYAVKHPTGYPLDLRRFDNDFIYDQQTEASWDDPGFIKLHVGNGGRGNRMAPRWLTTLPFTVTEATSPLYYIKNGQSDYLIKNAGPLTFTWNQPTVMNWQGDVGSVPTYRLDYYWSGVRNREQYFFAPPFGNVKWNHAMLQGNGTYHVDNDPPANNKLQTLADWQKTYPKLKSFTYVLPFMRGPITA